MVCIYIYICIVIKNHYDDHTFFCTMNPVAAENVLSALLGHLCGKAVLALKLALLLTPQTPVAVSLQREL